MNVQGFREFCLSLPKAEEGLPFDENTLVFSVHKKMFCLTDIDAFDFINVKCDPDKAVLLRERYEGVIPGYHMSKKHWNRIAMDGTIPDKQICEWIKDSYNLVVAKLPRKLRDELTEIR